ncbi:hypothetical protein QFZ99_000916 [Paraburkholderia atlantica]|uniref:hypothetical protein n=1 Tax=Paraburkholderia atlantica TaxID=2654982 RepID=UPI003D1C75C1
MQLHVCSRKEAVCVDGGDWEGHVMEPDADDHGHDHLWSNVLLCKQAGGFTWPEIADQMSFYAGDTDSKRLAQSLRNLITRRQGRWKHLDALARAWGVGPITLAHADFTTCKSPDALRTDFGFDVQAVIRRWDANQLSRARKTAISARGALDFLERMSSRTPDPASWTRTLHILQSVKRHL